MSTGHKACVLIVDDEPLKRITLQIELTEAGYTVIEAAEPRTGLRALDAHPVDIVVTDLRLPGMDGLAFLEAVKTRRPNTDVIVMTAHGTVDTAVAAIKLGAYDYICKPFPTAVLLEKLERIRRYRAIATGGTDTEIRLGPMIGASEAMKNLFAEIEKVADTDRTILIEGESGTGKELVAENLHRLSRRAEEPLIRFSCAALQPTVLESELFGHEKGAFTGAIRQKAGRFEQADGGTIFLDEVDDISHEMQVKLLRAVEQQAFERVGGEEAIRINVRLICATKKDLKELVELGQFREDLYYRLNVIHLRLPPLRDRSGDIPPLVHHFIAKHGDPPANGRGLPTISPHTMDLLLSHRWPGNVRELEHVVERALTFCDGDEIQPVHLPVLSSRTPADHPSIGFASPLAGLAETVADVERTMILSALRQADGNQVRAAQVLRIPRTTLRDKMSKYRIPAREPTEVSTLTGRDGISSRA